MNRRDFYYKLQSLSSQIESLEILGDQNEFLTVEDQEWLAQVREEIQDLASEYELRQNILPIFLCFR